jgi:hypothetical protein
VLVSFGATTLTSVTIVYDNYPGANNNPGSQSIGISNVIFSPVTLPVLLTGFNAHRLSGDVILNWKTQQEINARSFTIERNNANGWETIGSVNATGNSSIVSAYEYTDINPPGPVLLYRLKQWDIDNNYRYSPIIRLTGMDSKYSVLGYPNPFTKQVNVSINSAINQQVTVSMMDAAGNRVRTETRELYAGNNNFTIAGLERLSKGLYYVSIKDGSGAPLGQSPLIKD